MNNCSNTIYHASLIRSGVVEGVLCHLILIHTSAHDRHPAAAALTSAAAPLCPTKQRRASADAGKFDLLSFLMHTCKIKNESEASRYAEKLVAEGYECRETVSVLLYHPN